jgi:hypothetical protein
VADPVETIPYEQDGVELNDHDPKKSCKVFELSKQTSTNACEYGSSTQQNINPITCFSLVPSSETQKKLNCNINKSSLDHSSNEVIQDAIVEGNAAPIHEESIQESRSVCVNIIEHGPIHRNSIDDDDDDDDSSNKNQCVSSGKLNSFKTDNALDCMSEVHISHEDGTRRHSSCPLCWKTFEKNEAQMLHMKVCAARHNITTQQLLAAVELQDRQAAERQALGLPDIPTACTVKKSSRKVS